MKHQLKFIPLIEDRTGAETDDTCGMKYWLNRKEAGHGIVAKKEALPLLIGRQTHEDLALVADMELTDENIQAAIDSILDPLSADDRYDTKKMELVYRRLGWLAAWAIYAEPKLREEFEPVSVEKEIILDRGSLWVPVTPDRVCRRKRDKALVYFEFKTTISAGQKWMSSWQWAIQLHIGMAAIEEELGEKVHFSQIVGLMKGSEGQRDGRMVHPYVWGYYNHDSKEWSHSWEDGRKAGWQPVPIWEYPGGIIEWVRKCGEEVALSQFPHSQPVFLNTRMLEGWVNRRRFRQQVIRSVENRCKWDVSLRQRYFEQRTKNCRPAWGDPCEYAPACWNAHVAIDPLGSGEFIRRVPHHDVEATIIAMEETKERT